MPLVTSEKMLSDAQKAWVCSGSIQCEKYEMAKAVIAAAEEMRSPVMLQTTPSTSQVWIFGNICSNCKSRGF